MCLRIQKKNTQQKTKNSSAAALQTFIHIFYLSLCFVSFRFDSFCVIFFIIQKKKQIQQYIVCVKINNNRDQSQNQNNNTTKEKTEREREERRKLLKSYIIRIVRSQNPT